MGSSQTTLFSRLATKQRLHCAYLVKVYTIPNYRLTNHHMIKSSSSDDCNYTPSHTLYYYIKTSNMIKSFDKCECNYDKFDLLLLFEDMLHNHQIPWLVQINIWSYGALLQKKWWHAWWVNVIVKDRQCSVNVPFHKFDRNCVHIKIQTIVYVIYHTWKK